MKMSKAITVSTVGFFAALVISPVVYHLKLKSDFSRIERGESQADVKQTLGEPHDIVKCGSFGGYPAGCDKQFSYLSAITFWDVWTVSFDSSGHVVGKDRYRSP
jgi:hypothetical protein